MKTIVVGLLAAGVALAANADFIFINGRVVSMDAKNTVFAGVAIKGERITAVGRARDVLAKEQGPKTQVFDLQGRSVLPGLIDAHVHALDAGLSEFRGALPPLDSIVAIQKFIRDKARTTPKGEWIVVPRTRCSYWLCFSCLFCRRLCRCSGSRFRVAPGLCQR